MVTSHVPEPTPNFACNSPESILRFELWALKLQRFHTLLKLHPIELHASFLGGRAHRCPLVVQREPASQVCGCLEPASPLLARARVGLKPLSPLLA